MKIAMMVLMILKGAELDVFLEAIQPGFVLVGIHIRLLFVSLIVGMGIL